MAKRLVFIHEDREMTAYLNDKGRCFIEIKDLESELYYGYITLCKDDLRSFISELTNILEDM